MKSHSHKIDLSAFDVEKYLNSKHIQFDMEGKNVQPGWIGLNCLWCSDPSNHLGINLDTKTLSCWKCGITGTVLKLIMKLERCPLNKAEQVVQQFSERDRNILHPQLQNIDEKDAETRFLEFPQGATSKILPKYRSYLESRNFDPDFLYKKYNLFSAPDYGRYKNRIIIPIHYRGQMCALAARDVTGLAKNKYIDSSNSASVINPKKMLYNFDNAQDVAVVVEGPSDVWRIGDGAVATLGIKYTKEQVLLLCRFKIVFVLYDNSDDAQMQAVKLCNDLAAFVPNVSVLRIMDSPDPGEMSVEDVRNFRREIFGKIY